MKIEKQGKVQAQRQINAARPPGGPGGRYRPQYHPYPYPSYGGYGGYYGRSYYRPHYNPPRNFGFGMLFGFLAGTATAVAIGSISQANRQYTQESNGADMFDCNQLDPGSIKITSCKKLTDGKVCMFTWKENGDKDACYVKK